MWREREREPVSIMIPRVLLWAAGREDLTSLEMRNAMDGAGLKGKIRSSLWKCKVR